MPEKRSQRVNETCRCHHMKSRHIGLNGNGACQLCDCEQYTFMGWVYKEVLSLRNGDEVLAELTRTLYLKGYDFSTAYIVGVDILKIAQFSVSAEVQYAYGQ